VNLKTMQNKTGKTAIAVAVITAMATLGKAWIDARGADKLQIVVAAEVARNDQRWQAVERLIESQADDHKDMTKMREAVAALKVSVELLARNQRNAAREAAGGVQLPDAPKVVKTKAAAEAMLNDVGAERIQAVRDKLFNGD